MRPPHACPSCGTPLVDVPLRCPRGDWRLISREEWRRLPPREQGYVLYMQASWPTSELAGVSNPHDVDSAEWIAFRAGEQQAMLTAQDGEE